MTVDRAIEVLKQCIGDCGDCITCAEHDEAVALAIKGLLVLRSANSLFVGSDALVQVSGRVEERKKLPDLPTVGERIRYSRKIAGVTQEELAIALNLKRATISRYESDAIEPTTKSVASIANALNVDVAWLIGANCAQKTKGR